MQTRNSVTRIDSAWKIDADTGFLNAKAYPTRAGVFLYRRADGTTVKELRPESEVFDSASLASLNNKPFTNDHPPANVTAKTVRQYQTGHTHGNHQKSDSLDHHTEIGITVMDEANIADIQAGKSKLSCGYTCDVDETPGTHPVFGRYDAIQRNIRYNHLSNVWNPRAPEGKTRITQDCTRYDAWEIDPNETKETLKIEEKPMVKIRIDGHEVEVSEAAKAAFEALAVKHDNQIKEIQGKYDSLEAQRDAEKARADEAEKALNAAQGELGQFKLDGLIKEAQTVLPDAKFDGKTEIEIKTAVVNARFDGIELKGKSPEYLDGLYTAALKNPEKKNAVMDSYDALPAPAGTVDPIQAAYEKQIAIMRGEK